MTLGAGEVGITLDGKDVVLRSTLRAARQVNGMGGFTEVLRQLAGMNLEVYIAIVAAGLNKKPSEVEDAVYEAGCPALVEPLSEFVTLLANGGRPMSKASGEGGGTGEV